MPMKIVAIEIRVTLPDGGGVSIRRKFAIQWSERVIFVSPDGWAIPVDVVTTEVTDEEIIIPEEITIE